MPVAGWDGEGLAWLPACECVCVVLILFINVQDSSMNFERLLSVGESELASAGTPSGYEQKSETSSDRHDKHQAQQNVAAKKLKHLTELLRESEASALRLGEQAKVLKEEIRR